MASSDDLFELFERWQTRLLLVLHCGIRSAMASDTLDKRIGMQNAFTQLAAISPSLLDMVEFLRHLLALVSLSLKAAKRLYHVQRGFYMKLLEARKRNPGCNGTTEALSVTWKHVGPIPTPDGNLAYFLATSVHGGADTSPQQTLWVSVVAVSEPESMRIAQKTLGGVIGQDRLPTFADRPRLAYIEAVVLELMRWRPVVPSSIVRRAGEADEYQGSHIAKGITVFSIFRPSRVRQMYSMRSWGI